MINFDDYASENKTEHNRNWSYTPDHPYRILILGGWGSGKTNALLNLIESQQDIDKIYLYAKDPHEAKYQYHNICQKVGIDHFNDPKTYIEYSKNMHNVYKNIDDYNPDEDNKNLIVFDDMIPDMINSTKLNSIVTELFIRGRKLNISLGFITQSYFKFPKVPMLHIILLIFLSQKLQIKESFKKLREIIYQILKQKIYREYL